jgi:hypothetical protein
MRAGLFIHRVTFFRCTLTKTRQIAGGNIQVPSSDKRKGLLEWGSDWFRASMYSRRRLIGKDHRPLPLLSRGRDRERGGGGSVAYRSPPPPLFLMLCMRVLLLPNLLFRSAYHKDKRSNFSASCRYLFYFFQSRQQH